ncbi:MULTISPECIES: conjugal transfer protein TraO [Serratia]|uniref:conjugal transfer protein TraO n=1 Tax=Serratia TaxID=613 RepID=UPI000660F082|nr:conjugal transfer protein TraO [Serratia sp. 506_PEND]
MASENDAGRDKKLTLTLVASAVVALVGGTYFVWSWLATPPPAPSQVDINRVGASVHSKGTETPAYRDLLRQYNQEGVTTAQQRNSSFIASIPLEQEPVTLPSQATNARKSSTEPSARQGRSDSRQADTDRQRQDERRQKALDALLAQMVPRADTTSSPTGIQVAQALGGGDGNTSGGSGGDMSGFSRWSASLPGNMSVQTASLSTGTGGASVTPSVVVPPYWRGPGVIDIGVDSDNSTTPVLGRFVSGPYAGAVLKAPAGAKLAGDGVVIHFTEMSFGGVNYQVDAYALQDESLMPSVATEVNNRYFSRIVLPALLKGIGGIGEMYAQANTQVVTNGFNAVTTRPETPDGKAVAGVIAGGTASQAANVLSSDAARLPSKQVLIEKQQVVAIQFMRGVYSTDVANAGAATAPMATSPVVKPVDRMPPTENDWRAQTQARIEAQRRLQQQ